jgi:hypothetical protein
MLVCIPKKQRNQNGDINKSTEKRNTTRGSFTIILDIAESTLHDGY